MHVQIISTHTIDRYAHFNVRSARKLSGLGVCKITTRSWAPIPHGLNFYMESKNLSLK